MRNSLLILFVVFLVGCATKPKPLSLYDEIVSETTVAQREYIELRTGQVCEVKDMKIIACEVNPSKYVESKQDIEAIREEENED